MRPLAVLCLIITSLAPVRARAPAISPKQLQALPDQAQVRVLGRVTRVDAKGLSLRVEANGMTFSAERAPGVPMPKLQPGDRVLITGELHPAGKILLDTIQPVRAPIATQPLVGTLLSVDHSRRRLVLRSEAGARTRISYRTDTVFVRLGRRSRTQELRFGDRLWVDRSPDGRAPGTASRVEVVDAKEGRFSGVGDIIAVDSLQQQLRVRFPVGARTVLAVQATVGGSPASAAFRSLKVGRRVRVIGTERRGVIVAQRIEPIR